MWLVRCRGVGLGRGSSGSPEPPPTAPRSTEEDAARRLTTTRSRPGGAQPGNPGSVEWIRLPIKRRTAHRAVAPQRSLKALTRERASCRRSPQRSPPDGDRLSRIPRPLTALEKHRHSRYV
jgi:hypothetical protein